MSGHDPTTVVRSPPHLFVSGYIHGLEAVERVVGGPIGRGGGTRDIRCCGVVVRTVATTGTLVSIGGGSRGNPRGGVVQRADEAASPVVATLGELFWVATTKHDSSSLLWSAWSDTIPEIVPLAASRM